MERALPVVALIHTFPSTLPSLPSTSKHPGPAVRVPSPPWVLPGAVDSGTPVLEPLLLSSASGPSIHFKGGGSPPSQAPPRASFRFMLIDTQTPQTTATHMGVDGGAVSVNTISTHSSWFSVTLHLPPLCSPQTHSHGRRWMFIVQSMEFLHRQG